MCNKERCIDSKMISNSIVLMAIILSALYYYNNAAEIEQEVTEVIFSSLNDGNNSLAEQGYRK
ncbi:hypothetical protein [Maribacter sp. MAR_2009_72]|uniref:hypothetical protein n=1 Tax=Maribacter sp. MAR_2009_72 TaxID=1250050 RepID=UPI00119C17A7|nr:hypothetical protein [Maribacter sp. MAR_2009_72]TVZ17098.1 hypothetical protein JM81_3375 [Maribacter sp. MAR_2009_72]